MKTVLRPTPTQLKIIRNYHPGVGLLILNSGNGSVEFQEVFIGRNDRLLYNVQSGNQVDFTKINLKDD
jgi:hypothetical protein